MKKLPETVLLQDLPPVEDQKGLACSVGCAVAGMVANRPTDLSTKFVYWIARQFPSDD